MPGEVAKSGTLNFEDAAAALQGVLKRFGVCKLVLKCVWHHDTPVCGLYSATII